ncbi:hypothetical protein [Niabella hibiscisoli]
MAHGEKLPVNQAPVLISDKRKI